MAENISTQNALNILEQENFTIIDTLPEEDNLIKGFIIIHDLHPEEEITISFVEEDSNGEKLDKMEFTGPDVYTEEEAKQVLQEVMDVFTKIVVDSIDEGSESGSGSASGGE